MLPSFQQLPHPPLTAKIKVKIFTSHKTKGNVTFKWWHYIRNIKVIKINKCVMPFQSLKCLVVTERNVRKELWISVSERQSKVDIKGTDMIQSTSCVRHVGNNVMTSTCVEWQLCSTACNLGTLLSQYRTLNFDHFAVLLLLPFSITSVTHPLKSFTTLAKQIKHPMVEIMTNCLINELYW